MSSYRINLLKLIDLAIGSPSPGSVNTNLLHQILYILALKDAAGGITSLEADEIELSRPSTIADLKFLDEALKNGNNTRLTVQRRVSQNETDDDFGYSGTRLRIAGSRIIVPNGGSSRHSVGQPEHIESQMSAMSTMVSDLEERMQKISVTPSNACEEGLKELRRRILGLEKMMEQPIQRQTMDEPLPVDVGGLKTEMEKMWHSIHMLTEKIEGLQDTQTKTNGLDNGGSNADLEGPMEMEEKTSSLDKTETGTDMVKKIHAIESKQFDLDQKIQLLIEDITKLSKPVPSVLDIDETENFPYIADQIASLERAFNTKIGKLEHSIKRLFQEKADDVEIESRIRKSVRLSSEFTNRASLIPSTELPYQRRDDTNGSLSTVTDQLKATQDDLRVLKAAVQSMSSQDNLTPTIAMVTDQLQQLQAQFHSFQIAHPTEPEKAAGTKMKPILDLRCISCHRVVAMDRCDEIIPKPPLLRVTRVLKPNLRRQLLEVHKNMAQHGTAGEPVRSMAHFEKIYHSITAGKS
ncbi:uncharacterized protein LOC134212420 [Armigeres subalbatus]|uniref:uncharacterized protein LOC134212420 n=1 Tax=Armigeres subalbatus TaxID=124917 RepID=UPI002ED54B63